MNNDLIWTKTILSVYRYLERICGAIDKIVMQSAMSSGNIVGQNYLYNNVYSVSQKILDFSERKVTLINLKVLVEQTLGEIDLSDAKVLIERYVDGAKRREMAEKFSIALRSVYRKIEHAETAFSKRLKTKGYGSIRLQNFLKNEEWIKNAYIQIATKGEDDFELSNQYLSRAASL